MIRALLPPGSDRYVQRQLVFELVPAATLAAATGRWDLVAFAGAIFLPAVRRTWVHWMRHGVGLVPFVLIALLASSSGPLAVAVVWSVGCAIGIARLWWADRRPSSTRGPRPGATAGGSARPEDQDLVGLGEGDRG